MIYMDDNLDKPIDSDCRSSNDIHISSHYYAYGYTTRSCGKSPI